MSSPDPPIGRDAGENETSHETSRGFGTLLDTAFGYLVWAVHFLVVYVGTAVSCQLGLGSASEGRRTTFLIALALVTVAAAAIVVMHALRRYRQHRGQAEHRFRMGLTIGNDAVALVAITWQLLAISLVPLCA